MENVSLPLLIAGLGLVAFLYSSVGHAGASGYIAVMGILGVAAVAIRPTSLMLNLVVGAIAAVQFARAGHLKWSLLWPFLILAVPLAFFGGALRLQERSIELLLGAVLVFSAVLLIFRPSERESIQSPKLPLALVSGGMIGLLAGITGTGGGIFLTPLLLFAGWAGAKNAAAASALFILCNSTSGLAGYLYRGGAIPPLHWMMFAAVIAGGVLGSTLGARVFHAPTVKRLLALVLLIASWKLLVD